MRQRPATVLGFDYGDKWIGVAVGQTLTETTTALGAVRVKNAVPDWQAIVRFVQTWHPDILIVGRPLNMDGSVQATTRSADRFCSELALRFALPVHTADERLSTREARERIRTWGKQRAADDAVAAQVILETWFSEQSITELPVD